MRLKGRQARFLLTIGIGWVGARAYVLWPEEAVPDEVRVYPAASPRSGSSPFVQGFATHPVRAELVEAPFFLRAIRVERTILRQAQDEREFSFYPGEGPGPKPRAQSPAHPDPAFRHDREKEDIELPTPALAVARVSSRRRLEAQAYLFYRPGSSQATIGQGELGGSQIAARIAWRPTSAIGLAVRAYAPIAAKGAELSAGIDVYPLPNIPFRMSIERRQRADSWGRNAWSIYAAGGFYRGGKPDGAEVDGYAQAGIVGLQRRDGFVDGALRIGYRLPVTPIAAVIGVGVWGAAQPGVSRVDAGPRAVLRLPIGSHMISFALDGRLRVAGHARPGSGAALTLAADF